MIQRSVALKVVFERLPENLENYCSRSLKKITSKLGPLEAKYEEMRAVTFTVPFEKNSCEFVHYSD